jgi:hypothetical protein
MRTLNATPKGPPTSAEDYFFHSNSASQNDPTNIHYFIQDSITSALETTTFSLHLSQSNQSLTLTRKIFNDVRLN